MASELISPDQDLLGDLLDDSTAAAAAARAVRPVHPALRDAGLFLLNELGLRHRAGWEPFSQVVDPADRDAVKTLPAQPGVYVFLTPGQFHHYPGGSSSVMYIGVGRGREGLRGRLLQHQSCLAHVLGGAHDVRHFAAYEWAATYKTVATYTSAAVAAEDAVVLEHDLLLAFAEAFRVPPAANSQAAW